jgi:hypothetical protein
MSMPTSPETQPEVSDADCHRAIEVMVMELYAGIPKAEAHSIRSDAEATLWDRLARQIGASDRKAHVVHCDRDD